MAAQQKVNIIVLGDQAVGKSSLLKMYSEKKFEATHMATLGLDFVSKTYTPDSGQDMQVKIWDTAGQERFRTLTLSFYKQAQGVVLCFDVTNQKSFDNVRMWFEQIESHADAGIAKILVGNKVDLEDERKISAEQAKQMAESQGMKYYDASAKENINIDVFMEDLMKQVYQNKFGGNEVQRPTIKLTKKDMQKSDGGADGSGKDKKKCC